MFFEREENIAENSVLSGVKSIAKTLDGGRDRCAALNVNTYVARRAYYNIIIIIYIYTRAYDYVRDSPGAFILHNNNMFESSTSSCEVEIIIVCVCVQCARAGLLCNIRLL